MSKLFIDLEIAQTLGISVALILAIAEEKQINNFEELQNEANHALSFLDANAISYGIDSIRKFNLLKDIHSEKHLKLPSNKNSVSAMTNTWRPAKEVFEVVKFGGIPRDFVEGVLPEFRLYWSEKKILKDNWNKILIDHIRREWATNSLPNKGMPYLIDEAWKPSQEALDVLAMANISEHKALEYLKPFIMFWKDSGRAFKSWNSKFVEFVRRKELADNDISDVSNEDIKATNEAGNFSQKFDQRTQDKSWAEDIDFK